MTLRVEVVYRNGVADHGWLLDIDSWVNLWDALNARPGIWLRFAADPNSGHGLVLINTADLSLFRTP